MDEKKRGAHLDRLAVYRHQKGVRPGVGRDADIQEECERGDQRTPRAVRGDASRARYMLTLRCYLLVVATLGQGKGALTWIEEAE